VGDELCDRRLSLGEAADDPQPVDVGEGLVDEAQLAQVAGLDDGGRDRRANPGRRGGQGGELLAAVVSTTVYINRG
jgi:hypothetical protein